MLVPDTVPTIANKLLPGLVKIKYVITTFWLTVSYTIEARDKIEVPVNTTAVPKVIVVPETVPTLTVP
jgi:hypothetical protein